ncbi:MAG: M20/M25/M40 family metallo-hydrolase [Vicinamibacterales bacterium]
MRARLNLAAILLTFAVVTPSTQVANPPVAQALPAQPGTPASITEASVRGHMEFLASDALHGRGSGTRDEWIAAEYLASQLRRLGLAPLGDIPPGPAPAAGQPRQPRSFVQRIELRAVESTAPPTLAVGGVTLTHGKEMIVLNLGNVTRIAGSLVVYKPGMTVRAGAAVLAPDNTSADDRAAVAPASLVIVPETPAIRQRWDTAASRLPSVPARAVALPAIAAHRATMIAVDNATYAALLALPAGARVLFDPPLKYSDTPTYTWNAVGLLPGSDTPIREVILLSAHLDHVGMQPNTPDDDKIFNGADDDASGSVAVLELAKALAEGSKPKRTIVFAWFGSEERGGHGSNYFAELPVVPTDLLIANLQFEMIGRPDPKVPPQTLWLTGYERSNLGPELAKRGARLVQDPHPDQSFFTRSDNIRFARKGIPAHTVSSFGLHKEYHQPNDEVRLIDFPHMTEAIRSMLEPIRWLANDTFRPEWNPGGRPR